MSAAPQCLKTTTVLPVGDIDAVYAAVKSRGIPIARELRRENWPARGFNLADPSGNAIHLEQPE